MALRVLVMCMANICRSPIAEALLDEGFAEIGIDAEFSSAGFLEGGRPIDNRSVTALAERNIDATTHASTQVSSELVDAADLVVVMEADHLRRLVSDDPARFPRIFTLRGLAGRVSEVGVRRPAESMPDWLTRLNTTRTPRDYLGTTEAFDVSDPYRFGAEGYGVIAGEIAELVGVIVAGADGRSLPMPEPVDAQSVTKRGGKRRFWGRS